MESGAIFNILKRHQIPKTKPPEFSREYEIYLKKTMSNICTHIHELMYDPIFLATVVLLNIHLVLNLRTS